MNDFFEKEETQFIQQFLRDGLIVFDIENIELLDSIRDRIYEYGVGQLSDKPDQPTFFQQTQNFVNVDALNSFRVNIISAMAEDTLLRPQLFELAKKQICWLVGNELAMQNKCNLSIQMPEDDSSLLPIHSDVWAGNSPYELVFWLPLVDVKNTQSMFILPRHQSDAIFENFEPYANLDAEAFYHALHDRLFVPEIKYGQGLLFAHALLHGNRINHEPTTRWSFNVRFKSLLSPYGPKGLGDAFLPISMRPMTRLGYAHKNPKIKT